MFVFLPCLACLILAAAVTQLTAVDILVNYFIYPKDGTNPEEVEQITKALESMISQSDIYISVSWYLGTFFWWALMTERQSLAFINDHESIAVMFGFETIPSNPKLAQNDYQPNGPGSNISISRDLSDIQSTGRPRVGFSSSYILETNAPPELKIISQPMGVALDDKDYLGYYSDSTAGQDTRVYVVEIGAQTNHEELQGVNVDWLWGGPRPSIGRKIDPSGHGTCMVAKIAGKRCGSAKKANITMVSAAPLADKKVYRSWEGALDGLVQTYDDIRKKQLNGKAVINMSISFRAEDPTDISVQERLFFSALARLITEFARLDVIIVAAAGNGRANDPITSWPQVLGATFPNVIVVGGVDIRGVRGPKYQTAPYVRISAVATDFICPNVENESTHGYRLRKGTSGGNLFSLFFFEAHYSTQAYKSFAAAATVSGLVANLLTLGTPASQIPQRLYSLAYSRTQDGPPVLYNGIDFRLLADVSVSTAIQALAGAGALTLLNDSMLLNNTGLAMQAV